MFTVASYIYCYLYFNAKKNRDSFCELPRFAKGSGRIKIRSKRCVLSTMSLGSTVNSDGHSHAYIFTTAA